LNMFSERKFSTIFSSYWNQVLPRADTYLRRINLSCERYRSEISSLLPADRDRRSLINELGFRLFMEYSQVGKISDKRKQELCRAVCRYISSLTKVQTHSMKSISEDELEEASEIASSIKEYFRGNSSGLIFWPVFSGCGMINECQGDILQANDLLEIKAGDRGFRAADLRQVITYCGLNFSSKQYNLENIILLNPRHGLYYQAPIKDVIEECSGQNATDFFYEFIDYISTGANSR